MVGTVRSRTFDHPWRLASVLLLVGGASWVNATRRPVPGWELDLTLRLNDLPAWVAATLWPVMQLGSLWGAVVVSLALLAVTRDRSLAAGLVVAALVSWCLARVVKDVVERGRPFDHIVGLHVRGRVPDGYGFPSGHAAVAMTTAIVVMAATPRRWRPVLLVVPLAVGVARVVVGVHLPGDVVGGWALGGLVGLAAVGYIDRLRRDAARSSG